MRSCRPCTSRSFRSCDNRVCSDMQTADQKADDDQHNRKLDEGEAALRVTLQMSQRSLPCALNSETNVPTTVKVASSDTYNTATKPTPRLASLRPIWA